MLLGKYTKNHMLTYSNVLHFDFFQFEFDLKEVCSDSNSRYIRYNVRTLHKTAKVIRENNIAKRSTT